MRRRAFLGAAAGALLVPSVVGAQDIPAHNAASLTAPPPRPPLGAAGEARARRLLDAIVSGDASRADDFFLPRDAFRLIKRVTDPDPLWERLHRAYVSDIQALHAPELAGAAFGQLRFTGRRGWVAVGEEANRLPYWAQRHSLLEYTLGSARGQTEVRTMITWNDEWFITHLSEFHGR